MRSLSEQPPEPATPVKDWARAAAAGLPPFTDAEARAAAAALVAIDARTRT